MTNLAETRLAYQTSLEAHARLLDILSRKYVELLEEEEQGGRVSVGHKQYLQERIDQIYYVWDWTRHQLDSLPKVTVLG